MFEGTTIKWRFFDAHTSLAQPGLHYDPEDVTRRFGRPLSQPEIGICSSHVAVLDQYVKSGTADYVLVFEDDVIYDTDFPIEKFAARCAENGMSYVRLFGKHYVEAVVLGYFYDRHIIRMKTSPTGAQGYLMTKQAASSFIESFRRIDQPVDLAMDSFWRTGLPIYSIFPFPIIERYSRSQNLIPGPPAHISAADRLSRLYIRAVNKMKKQLANARLKSADRKMKKSGEAFQQVFDD
jgi:GR25 family glycosyltransferase involved in LPS biosynthesis